MKASRVPGHFAWVFLGLALVCPGWTQEVKPNGDRAQKIEAEIDKIAGQIGAAAKATGDAPSLQPAPTPLRAISENVDYPWTAAMAQKAFEKARGKALQEEALIGRWEKVAHAYEDEGFYNPKGKGSPLAFSAAENPFNENKRASVVVIVDGNSPLRTTSFEIRSPSVFFGWKVSMAGLTSPQVYEVQFECRLLDDRHLICQRTSTLPLTQRGKTVIWRGYVRLNQ